MKIAVYYDIPFGGAHVAMEEIISRLRQNHQIHLFHNLPKTVHNFPPRRLWIDLESICFQCFKQRHQASEIDGKHFDLVFVSHDRHFQAPWILRFLKTPSVFLCQEPTRALFEDFLSIDKSWPLFNRLYERFVRFIRQKIEIKNAGYATRLVSNSRYSSGSILRAYGRSATPVYMGINPRSFFPANLVRQNQVLVVGNHEPQKALSLAVEVVALITPKLRPKLVIVSPRHRNNLELIELAKSKRVILEIQEGIKTPDLCRLYNQSKVLLAVARLEPFGLSVVESLACGTPVLAVDEGGYHETIVTEKSGLLVRRDALALSGALKNLLLHQSLRDKMGLYGIKDVHHRFLWDTTVSKIEKIFHEII